MSIKKNKKTERPKMKVAEWYESYYGTIKKP